MTDFRKQIVKFVLNKTIRHSIISNFNIIHEQRMHNKNLRREFHSYAYDINQATSLVTRRRSSSPTLRDIQQRERCQSETVPLIPQPHYAYA